MQFFWQLEISILQFLKEDAVIIHKIFLAELSEWPHEVV
jgi:hypothetical protein